MKDRILTFVAVTTILFLALVVTVGFFVVFMNPWVFQLSAVISLIAGILAFFKPDLAEALWNNSVVKLPLDKLPFEIRLRKEHSIEEIRKKRDEEINRILSDQELDVLESSQNKKK